MDAKGSKNLKSEYTILGFMGLIRLKGLDHLSTSDHHLSVTITTCKQHFNNGFWQMPDEQGCGGTVHYNNS